MRFDTRELLDFFFPAALSAVRFDSLSEAAAFAFDFNGDDANDDALRFFASGFVFTIEDKDSFCFLLVGGGLWAFVDSTLLVLRFLLVVVDSPVMGCRFSLAAVADVDDGDNGVVSESVCDSE